MRPIASITGATYPELSPEASAAVARKLVDIVSLYHGENLSADQLDAVRERVAAQLVAAERLHRFPLANDNEPIFTVRAQASVPA
jgi:hypothetical protein